MHVPVDHVRAILACARQQAIDAAIRQGRSPSDRMALHRAEQTLLLTRLAADSGARRGEFAALQLTDLDGEVLTIARGTSNEVFRPPKTGLIRRLTLGPNTAALWRHTVEQWRHTVDQWRTEPARARDSDRGCSPAAPTTPPDCSRPASRIGSPNYAPTPATRKSPSTVCVTQSPQRWYPKPTSCRPNTGSGTATPLPRCGSTARPATDRPRGRRHHGGALPAVRHVGRSPIPAGDRPGVGGEHGGVPV